MVAAKFRIASDTNGCSTEDIDESEGFQSDQQSGAESVPFEDTEHFSLSGQSNTSLQAMAADTDEEEPSKRRHYGVSNGVSPTHMQYVWGSFVMHSVWLVFSIGLAIAAASWGMKIGARQQLEGFEGKLHDLEAFNGLASPACITSVRKVEGGWLLLRANGSEAGRIEQEACSCKESSEASRSDLDAESFGRCIVDTAIVGEGDVLQLRRLNGETASVQLRSPATQAAPSVSAHHRPSAAEVLSLLPQVPVNVVSPPSLDSWKWHPDASLAGTLNAKTTARPLDVQSSSLPGAVLELKPARRASEAAQGFPELTCVGVVFFAEWSEIKSVAQDQLSGWNAAAMPQAVAALEGLLGFAMTRLQSRQGQADECGMGRLCMSILAVLTGAAGHSRSLLGAQTLHSALLTIVLEVPWVRVLQSGWPLFALLAQLHLHTHGEDDLPQAAHEVRFIRSLQEGLGNQRAAELAKHGAAFLKRSRELEAQGTDGEAHAMPMLCALATQLLTLDVDQAQAALSSKGPIAEVQRLFREVVQSIEDMHATVVSAWPLYGILHAATTRLAVRR